ncbi:serine protease [Sulfitobacter pseudonitzschiae]|uniref:Serine protease n=1 Tax=Pseudosulfitobacter pseudonitzschiae TaxID=1402135 RepID=A0A9Q2S2J7_9RHOB|nr:serine protease [Pseudosulfitobacter pseudonitzschiae]MBM2294621.1 serine protease [Pseudosulfitobacter pseudonitzschiae]MBM2299607.1 serine protease [Pseudosulfitobacter pseudonitzschiae]MBM2304487.1 serine protease [Pseudosulfitobacter pseudonitzschiae]MBM2314251.1 serine protease [Pseudosulfitobacter pseudonitzschiae]MBM2319148.1 serine protease [Pseudosulfitobacter pseudonitzschiae]
MRFLPAVMATLALPLALNAQTLELPETPPAQASPFAFAESGAKAEAEAAAQDADSAGRVIGGEEAAEGAWPWQVALLIAGQPQTVDAQFCGGSMVLDTWVLTAAHCIHMQDPNGVYRDLAPQAISVLVGTNEIAEGKGDAVPVEAIYRHPGYEGTEFDNDIALIKLSRAPNVPYQTIKVPDAEFGDLLDQPGVRTVVTGWGLIEGAKRTDVMRQAEIQMLSRDQCNQVMLEGRAKAAAEGLSYAAKAFGLKDNEAEKVWQELITYVREPMTENMICSGTFGGGKGSCSGDSGGPLVVPLEDGTFIQAGIVSWGLSNQATHSCLETAQFSAYTRVSNYLPWLDQTINAN